MSKLALLATLLVLGATSAANAQTNSPIPATTNPDFIDYGGAYCNLFLTDIPEVINGTPYEVSATIHFTPGNSAATFGTIDLAYYPPNGGSAQVISLPLTDIGGTLGPWNGNSSFTANFSGALTGSLTLHVNFFSSWRGRATTYRMPNSYFTID